MGSIRSSGDSVVDYLRRQERSACSRIGAGQSAHEAIKSDRWANEAITDFNCQPADAERFVTLVRKELTSAIGPLKDRQSRVAAVRLVYGHYVEQMRGQAPERPLSPRPAGGKHMVYLLFDFDDALLYVGITDRGPVRLAEHYRHKPWFSLVCRVEFERYESRQASEAREKYLIQKRAPYHNIQYNLRRQIA